MVELKAKSLIAVSRIVKKKYQPKSELFTAHRLVEEVVQKLRPHKAFLEIEFRLCKSLNSYLYGHKSLIESVLLNMLESACRERVCDSQV